MPTAEKERIVKDLEDRLKGSAGLVFAGYKGLTMAQFDELRHKLRPLQCEFHVIKNTLTLRALKQAGLEDLGKLLEGPSAVIFQKGNPLGSVKVLAEFSKENEPFQIRGGLVDGRVVSRNDIETLARLPSREILLGQLLQILQGPATSLVSVLQAPVRDLVMVLDSVARHKSESGN